MKNFYEQITKKKAHNPGYGKRHYFEVPAMITIIGPTGSGKSNTLMNLIDAFRGTFQKFVICCMDFECDDLYVAFRERLEKQGDDLIDVYEDANIPDVEDLEEVPTMIVFDDMQGEKTANDAIAKFYKYGRKKGMTCVYLAQSYFDIPRFIRKQLKYLIIKRTNQVDELKRILAKYGLHQYEGQLAEIYNRCTEDFTHCMTIDLMHGDIYRDFSEKIDP